ncbi:DUF1574 domain-containing protein [Leptospira sp. GIMC2001]|uniref:DUF1574 domain-containing protein n=1 Tax=Leptospira sp. GIMC2001 TaxID=1513297 RepID=UPI00234A3744|nr:DUF1574 domain-containing protein [Leptospira sp. GIMC2001]WCL47770.1 DUF1574 domain-containing protein [Leptospira sp. GIMC2001]
MKTKKFLFYPIILFAFLFLVDKIFLLDSVRLLIKSDFTYVYYETKSQLLDIFIDKYKKGELTKDNKKVMVVLGSSRLLYFDSKELEQFYPDWEIYNFSSAVTTPAYYWYFLEQILDAGVKPDLVVLETDPNQFNINSIFKESNLTYSFDFPFILRYIGLFGRDYFNYYLGKTLFAVKVNKPYLDAAFRNYNNPNLPYVEAMKDTIRTSLIENKGHATSPVEDYFEKDASSLEATSQRTIDWLFASYKPSEMQFEFFDIILKNTREKEIPLIIVWPQSSKSMQDRLRANPILDSWKKDINAVTDKYQYKIHNMDDTKEYYCNSFADGGHIAKDCYRPFIRYLFLQYFKDYKPKAL